MSDDTRGMCFRIFVSTIDHDIRLLDCNNVEDKDDDEADFKLKVERFINSSYGSGIMTNCHSNIKTTNGRLTSTAINVSKDKVINLLLLNRQYGFRDIYAMSTRS